MTNQSTQVLTPQEVAKILKISVNTSTPSLRPAPFPVLSWCNMANRGRNSKMAGWGDGQ